MARKTTSSSSTEVVKSLIPIITDLFPLFLEKWAEINDRPTLKSIEDELEIIKNKLEKFYHRVYWLYALFFLLLVWNVFLTIFMIILKK